MLFGWICFDSFLHSSKIDCTLERTCSIRGVDGRDLQGLMYASMRLMYAGFFFAEFKQAPCHGCPHSIWLGVMSFKQPMHLHLHL